jgi:capsular exopolysaccharide synthesis family protein
MFTSTTSGEGKTFIACNLAVSTAMLGKRVLLMGMDIRRPRLAEMFKFDPKAEGFTSYLAADESEVSMLDRLILHSDIVEGFDIRPAGIVPPNPAELLSSGNVEKALDYLSKKYDFIILDTAPVGLVTDSLILSRVADAVVYVVRLGYTNKYDLAFFKGLVDEGKLENSSVVVNADELTVKNRYGYGGYSHNHKGYGYVNKTKN